MHDKKMKKLYLRMKTKYDTAEWTNINTKRHPSTELATSMFELRHS